MSGKGRQEQDHKSRAGSLCTLVFLAQLPCPILGEATPTADPPPLEQPLATVRECMAKWPPPWPQAWQDEYFETIRQAVTGHEEASEHAARLQALRNGFGPYWEGLRKAAERPLFEVHQAEIRWYVESLMAGELSSPDERQKLREQYQALMDYAAGALMTQFSFLDPNVVQAAKTDYLSECYRHIEAPLLPVFRGPLSEEQAAKIKERWHDLRYARVDLWRQLGGGASAGTRETQVPSAKAHPDYLLTERSLDQLRGQTWSLIPAVPQYYLDAAANQRAALKQRAQSQAEARAQERRLGVAVWQTEYLSFLLGALLETAQEQEP